MSESARRLLAIYLRDHRAGAVAGRRLAQRLAKENPHWTTLRCIAREIEADETTLARLMKTFGVSEGTLKKVTAVSIELVERLKPNGQLVGYSPLSRVLELESLMSGVTAKRRLWASLRRLVRRGDTLDRIDFEELDRRAVDQLSTLASLHDTAVGLAFLDDEAESGGVKGASVRQ